MAAPKRLVRVTWIDAADPDPDGSSWYSDKDVDDFAKDTVEVVSVGWVKSDTKLYLTLVADYILDGEDEKEITWGRPTKIPHGMIQKIEDLSATGPIAPADTPQIEKTAADIQTASS